MLSEQEKTKKNNHLTKPDANGARREQRRT